MKTLDTLPLFSSYSFDSRFYDELLDDNQDIRDIYKRLFKMFSAYSVNEFAQLNKRAKDSFFNLGITFQVYGENEVQEKIFPFDLFPRIINEKDWNHIERGVLQRCKALNLFLWDVYHEQKIIKQGIVPIELISSSVNYLKQMKGLNPPEGIYNHISGTDLIKHSDGQYYVLEDNIRCPSGVSYVIGNRQAVKHALFGVFNQYKLHTVVDYGANLLETMESVKPSGVDNPVCVVITPGVYNSAYYEHSFLAKQMGVALVEGRDLLVENDFVYMRTIYGLEKVDVIYRRIDDMFIDPLVFNKESLLGVPGLFSVYKKGNVTLVNAPGTGVADDKAIYTYMPEIIKYYLDETPILNNVNTYHCSRATDLAYVLDHIHELVVKPVDESGGYGISIGNTLTKEEIEKVKTTIQSDPRKYIAQPIMSLSTHPTFVHETDSFESRHVDLRTFTLLGKDKDFVLKGGLTRVALKKGNLVVNSSQGGGSKDTWVLKK
ncbi:circularly permuted type 2 ATP-grasp protein [Formosa sp. A9]|uniref:circularly permuted type 2 ATP-grasp protein n=1 Tax=Formosa sp. A9 TaxID=3442641 RepID=UPI003EB964DF